MLIVTLILSDFPYSNGANILYLNDIASPSHHIWNSAIVNALAARGHNVTYVSPDLDKNPPANVHYIHMAELYNEAYYEFVESLINNDVQVSPIMQPKFFSEYTLQVCKGDKDMKFRSSSHKVLFQFIFYRGHQNEELSTIVGLSGRFSIRFDYQWFYARQLFVRLSA